MIFLYVSEETVIFIGNINKKSELDNHSTFLYMALSAAIWWRSDLFSFLNATFSRRSHPFSNSSTPTDRSFSTRELLFLLHDSRFSLFRHEMVAYCLAIDAADAADADGSTEEEEEIDVKSHVVDVVAKGDICCSNKPAACNERDLAFLVSLVD